MVVEDRPWDFCDDTLGERLASVEIGGVLEEVEASNVVAVAVDVKDLLFAIDAVVVDFRLTVEDDIHVVGIVSCLEDEIVGIDFDEVDGFDDCVLRRFVQI